MSNPAINAAAWKKANHPGARLKLLREATLGQDTISLLTRTTGLARPTIRSAEAGETLNHSTLATLAFALGIHPNTLDDDNPPTYLPRPLLANAETGIPTRDEMPSSPFPLLALRWRRAET